MTTKLKCPHNIPEDECCKEKDRPVYKEREKKTEKNE
jgi:hypothetical protein